MKRVSLSMVTEILAKGGVSAIHDYVSNEPSEESVRAKRARENVAARAICEKVALERSRRESRRDPQNCMPGSHRGYREFRD